MPHIPEPHRRVADDAALRREITIALIAKFAALVVLYLLFFSPVHRYPVNLAERIVGDSPSPSLPLPR